jgi:hypothetical protein
VTPATRVRIPPITPISNSAVLTPGRGPLPQKGIHCTAVSALALSSSGPGYWPFKPEDVGSNPTSAANFPVLDP